MEMKTKFVVDFTTLGHCFSQMSSTEEQLNRIKLINEIFGLVTSLYIGTTNC
jgi:hypothetical protein